MIADEIWIFTAFSVVLQNFLILHGREHRVPSSYSTYP